jgi:inosine-uridine nucleoside N-ribohydrolase
MNDWERDQIEMWDLMTAELMMNPQHCGFVPLKLEIVTNEGEAEGQTIIVNGDPNISVCLKPNSETIRNHLMEVFAARK